jgi:DNA processing protein
MRITTRHLLAALQLRGVGPVAVRKLYQTFREPRHQVAESSPADLASALSRSDSISAREIDAAFKQADQVLELSAHHGIFVLSPFDETYPRALLDLPDFPPILYVKGSIRALANPKKLAVVGTRDASTLGLKLAKKIGTELSRLDVCVVSGLAFGIDTAAHTGALAGSGSTIAVMAHGLDQVAPKSNEPLARSILESNGALISEHQVGVIPRPPQFVFRNRLQSGLSRGSIVVESGFSGGSIHQGKFTSQQGRSLFVVVPDSSLPGSSEFKREGAGRLMAEFDAKPISSFEDLLKLIPEFRVAHLTNVMQGTRSADEI